MNKIFISYKTNPLNNQIAASLYGYLQSIGYDPWRDQQEMNVGRPWDAQIFKNLSESDVVILLVTKDADSPWVQREINYARGCRIPILPVVSYEEDIEKDEDENTVEAEILKAHAMPTLQSIRAFASIAKPEIRYADLQQAIDGLIVDSRRDQLKWVQEIREKWKLRDQSNPLLQHPTTLQQFYKSYAFVNHTAKVHIAYGDITQAENVDSIVNSENTYLQMERVFVKNSVSAIIRLRGADGEGEYIDADAIQNELNQVAFKVGRAPFPVGKVFLTSTGNSELRDQKIRYILHVAILHASPIYGELPLSDPQQVTKSVKNCFTRIHNHIEDHPDEDPISSIIFPVLAAGRGGLDYTLSANAMIDGFKAYLSNTPDSTIKDIYITGYTLGNVKELEKLLDERDEFVAL